MVPRHPVQPGGKRALRGVKALQGLKDFDENLLRQIFRFLGPPRETVAQIIDFSRIAPEQAFPSGVFTGEAPSKQFQILVH
jgi:hypothetical protein